MKHKKVLSLLISSILMMMAATTWAQTSTRSEQWQRICTPHFYIIFPDSLHRTAQRMANTLEHLYQPVSKSLQTKPYRISIVLGNKKADYAGHISSGPRMGFFSTFPDYRYNFLSNNDALDVLAVHEFRHVVQYSKLYNNFNRFIYWWGGAAAMSTTIHTLIPQWFFEGDAVGMETALTKSGRGRIPFFGLQYKANLLEHGEFSYQKQIFGSFKHKVPDAPFFCYPLGYYLTTHLRRKYGPEVLEKIFEKTTWLIPLHIAVDMVTGKTLWEIYSDANEELKACWEKQLEGLKTTPVQEIQQRKKKTYTDYSHPKVTPEDNVVVLKSGIGTSARFVAINAQKKERTIYIPGSIGSMANFSVANGQLLWVEEVPDLWYASRSHSVIKRFDLKRKKCISLTRKSRYVTAALSPDATQIIALESDKGYNHQLVLLNAQNGQIIKRFPNPQNDYYFTPSWSADGQYVVVIRGMDQKMVLTKINISTESVEDLLPPSEEHMGDPVLNGKYVFYSSAYNGIDNIYAFDLETRQRYQVTSRKYGAYHPSVTQDGQWLLFNDFTKDGLDAVKMRLDPTQWIPLAEVEDRSVRYYEPLVTQEENGEVLKDVPNEEYPVKPYRPWRRLLNVYSWTTDFIPNPSLFGGAVKPNCKWQTTVMSKNILDTIALQLAGKYDFINKKGELSTRLTYKGWYPVIDIEAQHSRQKKLPAKDQKKYKFYHLGLGLKFPLYFNLERYAHTLELSTRTSGNIQQEFVGNTEQSYRWVPQSYKVHCSRLAKQSTKDIHAPWGQTGSIEYEHTLYGSKTSNCQTIWREKLNADLLFYFPGLWQHHSLRIKSNYQYWASRGLVNIATPPYPGASIKQDKGQVYTAEVHYGLPIAYPDLSVGHFSYLKRLTGDGFYRLIYLPQAEVGTKKYVYAIGTELAMDISFYPFPKTCKFGIKCAYYPQLRQPEIAPVIEISL